MTGKKEFLGQTQTLKGFEKSNVIRFTIYKRHLKGPAYHRDLWVVSNDLIL